MPTWPPATRPTRKVWTNLVGVALCISLALIRSELYHVVITLLLTTLFLSFIIIARLNIV